MNEPESEERHVRPFADWMVEHRTGALASDLANELNGLVEAVRTHGKSGTLTLRLTVKPAGDGSMVTVTDEVVTKPPKSEPQSQIFFVDANSNLSRANPDQGAFELREVPQPNEPVNLKEVQTNAND